MTARRDPIDPRRKLFWLVDPQSIVLAMAIQSRAKTNDITEKLRAASSFLEYYVDGAYAAYQYHRHSAAASMGISVKPDQLPKWIALISEPKVALSIDDVPAEKSGQTNVHLHSDFDEELSEHTRIINGVKFLSPEILVVSGINEERPPLEDTLAILVVQRAELDWKKLLDLSQAYNATRFLGCVLDVLNFEARKPLFEKSLINKLFKRSNLRATLDFPASTKSQPTERLYAHISSKWNLKLHLARALVSKIVTDLVRS